ncbi:MAG: hypothetical protein ABJA80_02220 [bacterium]
MAIRRATVCGVVTAVAMLFAACAGSSDKPAAAAPPAASSVATATATSPAVALGPGEAMLPVRGGRIWYKRSGTGTGTPMVLLHGGPGAGHVTSWDARDANVKDVRDFLRAADLVSSSKGLTG